MCGKDAENIQPGPENSASARGSVWLVGNCTERNWVNTDSKCNIWQMHGSDQVFFSTTVIGNIPHRDTFSWLRDWQLSAVSHHSLMIGRQGKERKEQFHFPWNVLACCTAPFVLLPSAELECSKSACVTLEMSNCYLWLHVRWWVCREHVQKKQNNTKKTTY